MGRTFLSALLAGDPQARQLLPLDFRDPAARAARVTAASRHEIGAPLLAELSAQQALLPASAARDANLAALGRPGTTVAITGQQVGLFLGPLYTYYKAASVVAVARALERETGVRCVPIFWLQTEDHDFEEIAACHVLTRAGTPRTITIAADPAFDARSSIAHRCLQPDVEPALAALADALGFAIGADEVMAILRRHYRPGVPLGRAFGGALAELFADDGLLVFDPRVPAVARLAVPIYRAAIERHGEIADALAARKTALEAAGLGEQVPVRRSCALVFFHAGSATGPRFRLECARAAAGAFALAGSDQVVTADELERCLAEDPLRFSTSALLRPLLQDTLFPTAAYVGGPAELGYFAQLGPLYQLFGLPAPLPVLRARFRCLDDKTRRLLASLGLAAADLERPEAELIRRLAEGPARPPDLPTPAALGADVGGAIEPALERLLAALSAADATLARPVERTRVRVRGTITRLVDKYARALARRDTTTMERVGRLRAQLCPEGTPQERYYGWPSLAARVGRAELARVVAAKLVPFSSAVEDLQP